MSFLEGLEIMSQIQSYCDLLVWKLAMKLAKEVHTIT